MPRFDFVAAARRQREIADRISEIADVCQRENRERNDAESTEYRELCSEAQRIDMAVRANTISVQMDRESGYEAVAAQIRENLSRGMRTEIQLRSNMDLSSVAAGGMAPLQIEPVLAPLEKGLILGKLGIPFQTGLPRNHVWPVAEAIEASIVGEGVTLSDTVIPLNKLQPKWERIGVAVPTTNQGISASAGALQRVVEQEVPKAIARLINKINFGISPANDSTELRGCFNYAGIETVNFAGSVPTYQELLSLRGRVFAKGVEDDGTFAYVMSAAMKAVLEGTPKVSGDSAMICENGNIGGYPVLTTEYIGYGNIGAGVFSKAPQGLCGDIRIIVDPYTQSRKDIVDTVANADFGLTIIRPEAFILGKPGVFALASSSGNVTIGTPSEVAFTGNVGGISVKSITGDNKSKISVSFNFTTKKVSFDFAADATATKTAVVTLKDDSGATVTYTATAVAAV